MRATKLYDDMKRAIRTLKPGILNWTPTPGSGWGLGVRIARVNSLALFALFSIAILAAGAWYLPYLFLQRLVYYLETDPTRTDRSWGWVFVFGLFASGAFTALRESS